MCIKELMSLLYLFKVKQAPEQDIEDPISFFENLILDFIFKKQSFLFLSILFIKPVYLIIPLNII